MRLQRKKVFDIFYHERLFIAAIKSARDSNLDEMSRLRAEIERLTNECSKLNEKHHLLDQENLSL